MTTVSPDRQRIDKWLYFARVVKTRGLAVKLVTSGHARINGEKKRTASATVRPGDTLTIVMPRRVLVFRVVGCGERRGSASEAQLLYEDLSPPPIDTVPDRGF